MKCPFCGNTDTQVIDSRVSEPGGSIRRRRRCTGCQKRFTTYETVELRLPQVVKTNGNRAAAARLLGLETKYFLRLIKSLRID